MPHEKELNVMGALVALAICYFIFGSIGSFFRLFSVEDFTSDYWSNVAFAIAAYIAWSVLNGKVNLEKNKQKWEIK